MNAFANIQNSGLLKNNYSTGAAKGPVAQMNQNSPMMAALRKKRDALKTG